MPRTAVAREDGFLTAVVEISRYDLVEGRADEDEELDEMFGTVDA
ncbi:hypothetical protein ACH9DO_05065 [Kocuria sp. M1N1S27]